MGQDQSSPVNESIPSQTLKDRSVGSVAKYMKSGGGKRIVVMVSKLLLTAFNCVRTMTEAAGLPYRLGLASVLLQEYQTFGLQTLGFTRIWPD